MKLQSSAIPPGWVLNSVLHSAGITREQFFSEPTLYEVEFDVGQSRVEELAVASHLQRGSNANGLGCARLVSTGAA